MPEQSFCCPGGGEKSKLMTHLLQSCYSLDNGAGNIRRRGGNTSENIKEQGTKTEILLQIFESFSEMHTAVHPQ